MHSANLGFVPMPLLAAVKGQPRGVVTGGSTVTCVNNRSEWSRRQFLRYAAALGVATPLGLAACASDDAAVVATDPTAVPASTSPPVTAIPDPTAAAVPDPTATAVPELTTVAETGSQFDPSMGYWQQGGYRPVTDELDETSLVVRGSIPSSLDGLYVRNGSNGIGDTAHWFFGEGMVHGVEIGGGKALSYRNRYVRTPVYEAATGGPAASAVPGGVNSQSNVSVVSHGGRLLSLGEIGWPFELDPSDLSTLGPVNFDGALGLNLTAHPKVDPATGLMHAFGYGLLAAPFLTYYIISADGQQIVHSTPINVTAASMIHDFAITSSDVVFWEGPVLFDINMAISGEPIPYRWDDGYGARLGVMPLGGTGDQIRWIQVEPMFIFHGTNAYRDGDNVVIHASKLPDFFRQYDGLDGPSLLTKWTINTAGAALTIREDQLHDLPLDLPSYDRRFLTDPLKDAYYLSTQQTDDGNVWFEGITGYNFASGSLDRWISGPDLQPNEALFVADGESAGEGEGWLLSYAWDRTVDRSELVILDATDLASGPVASIELPQRVPFGFHAAFHR